jgi:hypothetical protein
LTRRKGGSKAEAGEGGIFCDYREAAAKFSDEREIGSGVKSQPSHTKSPDGSTRESPPFRMHWDDFLGLFNMYRIQVIDKPLNILKLWILEPVLGMQDFGNARSRGGI